MMPALALLGVRGPRWLPPLPLPLFLLWPLVPLGLGLARILRRGRPAEAWRLRAALRMFRELRGLAIDVDTSDHTQVRIRFL
jgi:hypothetical protein